MQCPTCSESNEISLTGKGAYACGTCGSRWSTSDEVAPQKPLAIVPAAEPTIDPPEEAASPGVCKHLEEQVAELRSALKILDGGVGAHADMWSERMAGIEQRLDELETLLLSDREEPPPTEEPS